MRELVRCGTWGGSVSLIARTAGCPAWAELDAWGDGTGIPMYSVEAAIIAAATIKAAAAYSIDFLATDIGARVAGRGG